MESELHIGGYFLYEVLDPDGTVVASGRAHNLVTYDLLDHILKTEFTGTAQIATWYLGLISNSGTPTLAQADTMASHGGWTEITSYDETTRVQWVVTEASRAVSNTSFAVFTINGTVAIKGAFVTSGSAKSGTTGTLGPEAFFDNVQNLINGQILRLTYILSIAST